MDPNQDGDFADHMDVVNLSLGSPYGWEYDTSAVAANNAALAGVVVVASAGNNGDIQLISSAPASAERAISVAATQRTADTIATFSSRGPSAGRRWTETRRGSAWHGHCLGAKGYRFRSRQRLWDVDGSPICQRVYGTAAAGAP